LNLKADFEGGSSFYSFKGLIPGAFDIGLIGWTCTALPRHRQHLTEQRFRDEELAALGVVGWQRQGAQLLGGGDDGGAPVPGLERPRPGPYTRPLFIST
jgi:hypothetical protein